MRSQYSSRQSPAVCGWPALAPHRILSSIAKPHDPAVQCGSRSCLPRRRQHRTAGTTIRRNDSPPGDASTGRISARPDPRRTPATSRATSWLPGVLVWPTSFWSVSGVPIPLTYHLPCGRRPARPGRIPPLLPPRGRKRSLETALDPSSAAKAPQTLTPEHVSTIPVNPNRPSCGTAECPPVWLRNVALPTCAFSARGDRAWLLRKIRQQPENESLHR